MVILPHCGGAFAGSRLLSTTTQVDACSSNLNNRTAKWKAYLRVGKFVLGELAHATTEAALRELIVHQRVLTQLTVKGLQGFILTRATVRQN